MSKRTVNILETPFFKHLFFDGYILKEDGYIPEISCEIFSKYLKDYRINNKFTEQFNNGLYENYNVTHDLTYNQLLRRLIQNPLLFKEYDKFVLLSGYCISAAGHSVNFFIEKQADETYILSIINSGEGLEKHPKIKKKESDENLDTKFDSGLVGGSKFRGNPLSEYSVMLQYKNVTFDTIIKLINFTYLMVDPEIRNRLRKNIYATDELLYNFQEKTYERRESFYAGQNFINPLEIDSQYYGDATIRIENLNKIIESEPSYADVFSRNANIKEHKYDYGYKEKLDNDIKSLDKLVKEKERTEYIKQTFPSIKEFLLTDSKFNLTDNLASIHIFYSYIKHIITNFDTPDANITDNAQESSSCAFFSTYYTLKFFFFSNDYQFNNFINRVKLDLLTHLKETLELASDKNPNINFVNAALLLIKDYSENKFFFSVILKIKDVVTNLFKNNFSKCTELPSIRRYGRGLEIQSVFGQKKYEKFLKNINFLTYFKFTGKIVYAESSKNLSNIKYILVPYMFQKASILLLNSLKELKITTKLEFLDFHTNISYLCDRFVALENIRSDALKVIVQNMKLKFLNTFLTILEDFNLPDMTDSTENIFEEPNIIRNSDKVWNFIYNGYTKIRDYEFDLNQLFQRLINKYDLLVTKKYFDERPNNGEFFYLLGFDKEMTVYEEFIRDIRDEYTMYNSRTTDYNYDSDYDSDYDKKYIKLGKKDNSKGQVGGSNVYGFDFVKYYEAFLDMYDKRGVDNYSGIEYRNIDSKITNKMYIKFGNSIKYDNDDLTKLNELIDNINSSDKKAVLDITKFLIYDSEIKTNFLLYELQYRTMYYKKFNNGYVGIKKNSNTDTYIILPTLIAKLNIDGFIENISLMSEHCIDTIAFLLHKYRNEDYNKYRVNDFLSDTSLFKIISANNEELYKIFYYISEISYYDVVKYGEDIYSFNNKKNKVCDHREFSVSFLYYVLEQIGLEKINDTVLFNSVQKGFNEYSSKSKMIGNYLLLNANYFDYNLLIYKDILTDKTYYKTDKQKKIHEFEIVKTPDFNTSCYKIFFSKKFRLIKVDPDMPEILKIFYTNLSSTSVILLWKRVPPLKHLRRWLIELTDFDKILQFDYDLQKNSFLFCDDDDVYTVVTEYNKLIGMLVYNSPNMLVLSKDNKYFILLINSIDYYKSILSYNKLYWVNNFSMELPTKSTYDILEINPNLLTFNIKSDEYLNLLRCFVYNKNNYGIFLIIDNCKNIINCSFKKISSFDVPFVKLYDDKLLKGNCNNKNFIYQDISTSLFNKFLIELDTCNLSNITIINTISDKINSIKNKEYGEIQQKIIDNKHELKLYIGDFRANCQNEYTELKDYIEKIVPTTNDNFLSYLDTIFDELTCNKTIHSLPSLYVTHCNIFYNIIISNLYYACIDKLKKLSVFSCEQLLKKIVFLDHHEIYPVNKIRNIEDVIFEIHTNYFIKQEQKTLVKDNILMDLSSNINNKVYEILMGKGKTTTITPLTLINQIFTTCIKNYNIVLPKHLVPSSFDIITNYSQIFYNYNINNGIQSNFKNDNVISIISDALLKEFILTGMKKIHNVKTMFNQNNLFIFDEIDTLIDSNKSELNMPSEDYPHQYSDLIFNNIINVVVDYYEKKDVMTDNIMGIEKYDTTAITHFRNKMKNIFVIVKRMIYNQNYGFAKLKYSSIDELQKNKSNFIAVPYSANNTPINESEFTDFELAITLTILSYLNNGLRSEDLFIIFRKFTALLAKTIDFKMFLPDFITEKMLNDIIKMSGLMDHDFMQWCSSNISIYGKDKNLIIYYLREIILQKYFKISDEQYNISMVDLLDHTICKKKILFSGTVNFYLLSDISKSVIQNYTDFNVQHSEFNHNLLSKIISDDKSKGSIYSAIFGITTKLTQIIPFEGSDDYQQTENDFMDFILNIDNLNTYDAVIDAAGLIIDKTSTSVVNLVYKQMSSTNIKKTILFINEFDNKMIYYGPDNIQKYNNELFENLFIY